MAVPDLVLEAVVEGDSVTDEDCVRLPNANPDAVVDAERVADDVTVADEVMDEEVTS